MRFRSLVAVALVIAIAGCDKRDIPASTLGALEGAERYELLSLDPTHPEDAPPDNFHGWRVLGQTSVADTGTQARLNAALRAGAQASDGSAAACFDPRHGIRVTKAGKVTDVVICFECSQARVYEDGKKSQGFLTTASPQAAFDGVLREAGVLLAEKPK